MNADSLHWVPHRINGSGYIRWRDFSWRLKWCFKKTYSYFSSIDQGPDEIPQGHLDRDSIFLIQWHCFLRYISYILGIKYIFLKSIFIPGCQDLLTVFCLLLWLIGHWCLWSLLCGRLDRDVKFRSEPFWFCPLPDKEVPEVWPPIPWS